MSVKFEYRTLGDPTYDRSGNTVWNFVPAQPHGDGWELVSSAGAGDRIYWTWRRELAPPGYRGT